MAIIFGFTLLSEMLDLGVAFFNLMDIIFRAMAVICCITLFSEVVDLGVTLI